MGILAYFNCELQSNWRISHSKSILIGSHNLPWKIFLNVRGIFGCYHADNSRCLVGNFKKFLNKQICSTVTSNEKLPSPKYYTNIYLLEFWMIYDHEMNLQSFCFICI